MGAAERVEIQGKVYYPAGVVAKVAGVSRQTLWRWRLQGKIPAGHRYRDRHVVFTPEELEVIREFADRLEPVELGSVQQG